MIIGLFIDVWNWLYTRNRIQLMHEANIILETHKLRISVLGVLYTIVEIDKSIPDALIDKFIMKKLGVVDDALVAINLDGLMHLKYELYAENDMTRFVLIKFIPNMPHWTFKYITTSVILIFVLYKVFMYFDLWTKFLNLIKPILHAIH